MEAYQHNGLPFYYDALAMEEKVNIFAKNNRFKVNIWQGDKDPVWTIRTSGFLKDGYQESQLFIIRDTGHLLYLAYRSEVLEKVSKDFGKLKR